MKALSLKLGILSVLTLLIILTGCDGLFSFLGGSNGADQLKELEEPFGLETGSPKAMEDTKQGDPEESSEEDLLNGAPVTYRTTTQKYKASASYDTQILLNPSADVIYPGSVILGHTIDDGSYVEVTTGTKREVTLSFDLTGVKDADGNPGIISGTIVPTLSGYRELRNTILSQEIPKQSSIYSFEMIEIDDESELDVKLDAGVTYSGPGYKTEIKGGFDFSQSNTNSKILIKFMQTFYTVDINQGEGLFLFETFDLDSFGDYRPVYVSSVAYGRLAYLSIETQEDSMSIKSNLEVLFSGPTVSGEVAFEQASEFISTKTQTNITVIGGTDVAIGLESFINMLKDDSFSETNTGKIIAYKLRFVDDNTIANTVFNGEYTVRSTETVIGGGIDVGLRVTSVNAHVVDGDSSAEIFGSVTYTKEGESKYLWSYPSSNYYTCTINEETPFSGEEQTFNFGSESGAFTIEISNFKEVDTFDDDEFNTYVQEYTIADLTDGETFTARTYCTGYPGEWVDFTIEPSITYNY
ncbi:MAG: thiol-activated cytolysin family protein [Spirochaetia bacterium]